MTDWTELAKTTLRTPRVAAQQIMAMKLGRDVVWTALFALAALNAIVLHLTLANAPPAMQAQLPGYTSNPLTIFMLLAGMMVLYFHMLYWSGLSMGGTGNLYDLVALLVWLQVLRTVVQILTLGLTFTLPALAGIVSLVAAVWALWILICFVTEALNLPGIGHAVMALVVSLVGVILGLGTLLALLGAAAMGVTGNV